MNTRDKILEEIKEDERVFETLNLKLKKQIKRDFQNRTTERLFAIEINKAKLEGYDLAQKEELEYWEKVRNRKGHTDDNSNGIKNRVEALKKQIEKGDKKE
jgi:hypothetical protein